MVYSIDGVIVFGTAFSLSNLVSPVIINFLGETVSIRDASIESDLNKNMESRIYNLCDKIEYNMALGKKLIAQFREYVFIKNTELGISGNGIVLLESFYLIECALLAGMLFEAYEMILALDENDLITTEFKTTFSLACKCADHLK